MCSPCNGFSPCSTPVYPNKPCSAFGIASSLKALKSFFALAFFFGTPLHRTFPSPPITSPSPPPPPPIYLPTSFHVRFCFLPFFFTSSYSDFLTLGKNNGGVSKQRIILRNSWINDSRIHYKWRRFAKLNWKFDNCEFNSQKGFFSEVSVKYSKLEKIFKVLSPSGLPLNRRARAKPTKYIQNFTQTQSIRSIGLARGGGSTQ